MATLQERLARGDVILLDGAMGTELERRGVPMHGEASIPELVCISRGSLRDRLPP